MARALERLSEGRLATRDRVAILPVLEVAVLGVGLVLPHLLEHFWVVLATRIAIVCLVALSFDVLWGYAGIMSFGQALFYGTAAYSAALLARDLGITSIFVIVPVCTVIGLVLALVMAWFLLLGRHPPSLIFVGLGTLTGSYAADRLARGWYYLGGQNGIPSIPPLTAGSYAIVEGPAYYYLALGTLVAIYGLCRVLVRSQFGLVLAGIRQREDRITFLGYRVQHYKALIFTLAGGICGLAGGLIAFHDGFVWPNLLGVFLSTQIVLYVLFGGVGTLIGAIIGVATIEYASFVLADRYPGVWPILLGLLLLVVVLVRPTGLCGLLVPERERVGRFGRAPAAAPAAAPAGERRGAA
jgi:branched-chain amino acid transport system permease protein